MGVIPTATFEKGGWLPHTSPPTRTDRICEWIALRAWVGRRRRVGLSHWQGGGKGVPLAQLTREGIEGQVFTDRGGVKYVRIPGTGWCLATHRRKP